LHDEVKGRAVGAVVAQESGDARGEDDVLFTVVRGGFEQPLEGGKGLALHESCTLIGASGGGEVHQ
jgi:hypothetical protein